MRLTDVSGGGMEQKQGDALTSPHENESGGGEIGGDQKGVVAAVAAPGSVAEICCVHPVRCN